MKYDLAITTFCQDSIKTRYDCVFRAMISLFDSDLSLCGKIIVSDDGSEDKALLDFLHFINGALEGKVKVVFNPNRAFHTHGVNANVFKSFDACESEYIVRLSDDTICHPTWMQQLSALQTKVEEELKEDWGNLSITNWGIWPLFPDAKIEQKEVIRRSMLPSNLAALYKKSIWTERFPSFQGLVSEIHENQWREQGYQYEWAYADECFKRGLYSFTTETSFARHLLRNSKIALSRSAGGETQVSNYAGGAGNPADDYLATSVLPTYGTPITEEHEILLDHGKPIQDPPPSCLSEFIKSRLNAAERIASKSLFHIGVPTSQTRQEHRLW